MKHDESEPEEDLQEDDAAETDTEDDVEDDVAEVTDNVGDPSVEINVEALIHELELEGLANQIGREAATRRRLEELMEQRRARRELEDFDDYEI